MKLNRYAIAALVALACTQAGAQTPTTPATPNAQAPTLAEANANVFKACAQAPASKGVCPLNAIFGLYKLTPESGILDFRVSNTVPRVVTQNYGWMMKLNRKSGTVRVLERFTLPEAPRSWGAGGVPHGMSADRKTLSLDVILTIHNGVVYKSWDVAEGDPVGHHHITVFLEDSPPVEFEFDVVDPK